MYHVDLKWNINTLQRIRNRVQDVPWGFEVHTSRSKIVSYVEDNPGARTPEITQRVADTVPGRVASHLDALEGQVIEQRVDGYYLCEQDE